MCSPVTDCRWCSLIETCSRVAAAFPTKAETKAALYRHQLPCSWKGCTQPKEKYSTYCAEHKRRYQREAYARKGGAR